MLGEKHITTLGQIHVSEKPIVDEHVTVDGVKPYPDTKDKKNTKKVELSNCIFRPRAVKVYFSFPQNLQNCVYLLVHVEPAQLAKIPGRKPGQTSCQKSVQKSGGRAWGNLSLPYTSS